MVRTRNGAGGDGAGGNPNPMEGIQAMLQDMFAQHEARFQDMLDAHKHEVEQNVRDMLETRSSANEDDGGEGDPSVESGHDGHEPPSEHTGEVGEDEVVKVRCTYKDFNGCKPPTFDGTPNPLVLHKWIIEMEMAFTACQCLDSQRTNFAITKLKDDALEWWLDLKETTAPGEINRLGWGEFLERMKSRFCTNDEVRQLEKEFLSFKKGSLTIAEYNSKFRKLMSFSRRMVPDEATKIAQYLEGLPLNVRMSMADPTSLQQAMKRAITLTRMVEDHEKAKGGSFSKKRKFGGSSKGKGKEDSKKSKFSPKGKGGSEKKGSVEDIVCYKCGKTGHFANQCRQGIKCFECNEMGHLSYDCPNKKDGGKKNLKKDGQKAKGRAFQMTADEAREEADVVVGTFLVNSVAASILIDTGATYLFVSKAFSKKLKLPVCKLKTRKN